MNIHFNGNILMNGYFLGITSGSDDGGQRTVQSASYTIPGGDKVPGDAGDEIHTVTLPSTGSSYPILIHHAMGKWKSLQHFCTNFNITPCGTASE